MKNQKNTLLVMLLSLGLWARPMLAEFPPEPNTHEAQSQAPVKIHSPAHRKESFSEALREIKGEKCETREAGYASLLRQLADNSGNVGARTLFGLYLAALQAKSERATAILDALIKVYSPGPLFPFMAAPCPNTDIIVDCMPVVQDLRCDYRDEYRAWMKSKCKVEVGFLD